MSKSQKKKGKGKSAQGGTGAANEAAPELDFKSVTLIIKDEKGQQIDTMPAPNAWEEILARLNEQQVLIEKASLKFIMNKMPFIVNSKDLYETIIRNNKGKKVTFTLSLPSGGTQVPKPSVSSIYEKIELDVEEKSKEEFENESHFSSNMPEEVQAISHISKNPLDSLKSRDSINIQEDEEKEGFLPEIQQIIDSDEEDEEEAVKEEVKEVFKFPIKYKTPFEYLKTLKSFAVRENKLFSEVEKKVFHAKFRFAQDQKQITNRLMIDLPRNTCKVLQGCILQVELEPEEEKQEPYKGNGIVNRLAFNNESITVILDINIEDPYNLEGQDLPNPSQRKYKESLKFCILEPSPMKQQLDFLHYLIKELPNTSQYNEMLYTLIKGQQPFLKHQSSDLQLHSNLMLSVNQQIAITQGLLQSLSLIQGPPGTGKTEMITQIVHQWYRNRDVGGILVCAPSNYAADLLAEKLSTIPALFDQVVRIKSARREDIFTVIPDKIPQFSLTYKILYMCSEQRDVIANMLQTTTRVAQVQKQVDYYFSDVNYYTDKHLLSSLDAYGLLDISELLKWNRMKNLNANIQDVILAAKYSQNFKVVANGVGKKDRSVITTLHQMGLDPQHGIRNMTKEQYCDFKSYYEATKSKIIECNKIVVCTCNTALHVKKLKQFTHVIIDEATQASEGETLQSILTARQAVLVGDQNQLSPSYFQKVQGPRSMFQRLIRLGYPYVMLDESYRLHPLLLKVPNILFYENKIKSKYNYELKNRLLEMDRPLLFINCTENHQVYGNSFVNKGEVLIVKKVVIILQEMLSNRPDSFQLSNIGFVTPYNGQYEYLRQALSDFQIDDNIRSIDSWQGREKEVIICSTVRSQGQGFLGNKHRINVALTRAKHALIIVGNSQNFKQLKRWAMVIEMCEKKGRFFKDVDEFEKYVKENMNNTYSTKFAAFKNDFI